MSTATNTPGQDPANTGDPQAGNPVNPPANPATPPAIQPPASPATPPVQTFDAAYVAELREEAAQNRIKAKDFETKFTTANQELDAVKAQVKANSLKFAITQAPTKVVDPAVALSLIDQSKITFDDKTGEPTNLDELLKELVAAKPYLAGETISPTNPTNPARPGAKFTLEQIKTMSPDEINANWDEVQAVLGQK